MTLLVAVLLLLVLGVALLCALLRLQRDLLEDSAQDAPFLQDPGPIFHDQAADYREVRSRFAWQSRSHSRAPD